MFRSAVYIEVNEQRNTENQCFMAEIVEMSTDPKWISNAYASTNTDQDSQEYNLPELYYSVLYL